MINKEREGAYLLKNMGTQIFYLHFSVRSEFCYEISSSYWCVSVERNTIGHVNHKAYTNMHEGTSSFTLTLHLFIPSGTRSDSWMNSSSAPCRETLQYGSCSTRHESSWGRMKMFLLPLSPDDFRSDSRDSDRSRKPRWSFICAVGNLSWSRKQLEESLNSWRYFIPPLRIWV